MIEASRTERDEPGVLIVERLDDLAVDNVVDEDADGGESGGKDNRLGVQPGFEKRELVPMSGVGRQERRAVMRLGTEENDSHCV